MCSRARGSMFGSLVESLWVELPTSSRVSDQPGIVWWDTVHIDICLVKWPGYEPYFSVLQLIDHFVVCALTVEWVVHPLTSHSGVGRLCSQLSSHILLSNLGWGKGRSPQNIQWSPPHLSLLAHNEG